MTNGAKKFLSEYAKKKVLPEGVTTLRGNAIEVGVDMVSGGVVELTVLILQDGETLAWWKPRRLVAAGQSLLIEDVEVEMKVKTQEA